MTATAMTLEQQSYLAALRDAEWKRKSRYAQLAYYRELLVTEMRFFGSQHPGDESGYLELADQAAALPLTDHALQAALGRYVEDDEYPSYSDPCFDGMSANEYRDLIQPLLDRFLA